MNIKRHAKTEIKQMRDEFADEEKRCVQKHTPDNQNQNRQGLVNEYAVSELHGVRVPTLVGRWSQYRERTGVPARGGGSDRVAAYYKDRDCGNITRSLPLPVLTSLPKVVT